MFSPACAWPALGLAGIRRQGFCAALAVLALFSAPRWTPPHAPGPMIAMHRDMRRADEVYREELDLRLMER